MLTKFSSESLLGQAVASVLRIENLDSFYQLQISAKPGRRLSRIAGWVLLLHEDRTVLQGDLTKIRELEASGLYQIESEIER